MRILFVCQHYWPEPFNSTDVCETLVSHGHEVTVLTGLPNTGMPGNDTLATYRDGKRLEEIHNGVSILRVKMHPRKFGAAHRVANYLTFWHNANKAAKRLEESFDVVLGYQFSPIMQVDPGVQFAEKTGMELVTDERYMLRDFLRRALAAEGEAAVLAAGTQEEALAFMEAYKPQKDGRCCMCYAWRLEQAARYAAENGFSAFTSTLFYSIYQQHDVMKNLAGHFAEVYGVAFYYEDFRPGWQEGIDVSLELGLYRQGYCGCVFSEEERYSREMRKAVKKAGRARRKNNGRFTD